MQITATARYIRVSPRKLQLLARGVAQMSVDNAVKQLTFLEKSGADDLKKVIESALANAKNKQIDTHGLTLSEIHILPGGSMKRFRAVSRGMAHSYKKRMSHIKVILSQKPVVKTAKKEVIKTEKVQ